MAYRNRKAAGVDRPKTSPSQMAQSRTFDGMLTVTTNEQRLERHGEQSYNCSRGEYCLYSQ